MWINVHENKFLKLKYLLSTSPVLTYFDENEPMALSVDSIKDGLVAVILQKGQPIAYASNILTDCQKNYVQIEKELWCSEVSSVSLWGKNI